MAPTRGAALLLAATLAAGCGSEPPIPSPAPPIAALPGPPTAGPVPSGLVIDSLTLLPSRTSDGWLVIGLVRNQAGVGATEVRLRINLLDGGGQAVQQTSTPTLLSSVVPGGLSPFSAAFPGAGPAVTATARIESYRPEFARPLRAGVEVVEATLTESGELALLGSISNPGSAPFLLGALGVVGFDPSGRPLALAPMRYGPRLLGPGESAPFLAVSPHDPGPVRWRGFYEGVGLEAPPDQALVLDELPRLQIDSQGSLFVVGSLRNGGNAPTRPGLLISLLEGSRVLSLTELRLPVALQAGERLAFAAQQFPGLGRRLPEGAAGPELRIEIRIEGTGAEGVPLALPVEVRAIHSVGASLFLRGTLRNPSGERLLAAAVIAELRSPFGELLSAGWFAAPEPPEPGESAEFVIELPLPAGSDPAGAEFDLRALGTLSEAEN